MQDALGSSEEALNYPSQSSSGFHFYVLKAYHFPGESDSKESACNAGDPGLIPGLARSPGEGNGNPLK